MDGRWPEFSAVGGLRGARERVEPTPAIGILMPAKEDLEISDIIDLENATGLVSAVH